MDERIYLYRLSYFSTLIRAYSEVREKRKSARLRQLNEEKRKINKKLLNNRMIGTYCSKISIDWQETTKLNKFQLFTVILFL